MTAAQETKGIPAQPKGVTGAIQAKISDMQRKKPTTIIGESLPEQPTARELLREALEFTKYAAAAFAWEEKGSATPEWFAGLRQRIEKLQPRIDAYLASNEVSVPVSALLAVRDAIIEKDVDEAYHRLYTAVEWQDPYHPWAEWEAALRERGE